MDKMEFLDIYRTNDWDAKVTMTKLSTMNRNRKDQEKVQKVEEDMQRKKLSMEKKEEMKKQKTTEKEMESIARNAMKLKLRAKKVYLQCFQDLTAVGTRAGLNERELNKQSI